ncbi:hypothetical protein T10_3221 [Trichinella papuae]|uniref:Uncharacterized protein n=1 Tax=Trichinella papuae TaxID=268474 RepID=A0A0V1MAI1_9BILA|nr:hypothetical protein T10_3221 [Trichinella papuae]
MAEIVRNPILDELSESESSSPNDFDDAASDYLLQEADLIASATPISDISSEDEYLQAVKTSVADGFVIQHFGQRRGSCLCFVELQTPETKRHKIIKEKAVSDGMMQECCGKHPLETCSKSSTTAASPSKESDGRDGNDSGSTAIVSGENIEKHQKKMRIFQQKKDKKCNSRCSNCSTDCCREHLNFLCKNCYNQMSTSK